MASQFKVTITGVLFKITKKQMLSKMIPRYPDVYMIYREKAPFTGRLCLPGGSLEFSENCSQGIKREIKEETDLDAEFMDDLISNLTDGTMSSTGFNFMITNKIAPAQNPKETNLSTSDKEPKNLFQHYLVVTKLCYLGYEAFPNTRNLRSQELLPSVIPGKWLTYKELDGTPEEEFAPNVKECAQRGYRELDNFCKIYSIYQYPI